MAVGVLGGSRADEAAGSSGGAGSMECSRRAVLEGVIRSMVGFGRAVSGLAGASAIFERGSGLGKISAVMGGPEGSGCLLVGVQVGHQAVCDKVMLALGPVGGTT